MTTELWFRNPQTYVRELIECGQFLMAWDRGFLVKRKIDPIKHASLYFGTSYPWRALAIGPQGTAEYQNGDEWDSPTAVYPTWSYGEDQALLEEMLEKPAGQDIDACTDKNVDGNERPVFGQEHRVVIIDAPNSQTGPGRQFLSYLKTLQEDYPEAIIHFHGTYSYRVAFGLGLRAADIEPRMPAQKGKITLPNGKNELYERVQANPRWVTQLGFKPVDLSVPRVRCMYNIKSAAWAAEHFASLFNFRQTKSKAPVDTQTPAASYQPPTGGPILTRGSVPQPGDKMTCNTCSLQNNCKHFRIGAVCSLPDAESKQLASYFNTRDAESIIDGLGAIMAAGANRLQEAQRVESILGDIDPEVTKMMGQLFGQGEKLAKLIDPKLRGGVKVNVNTGGGAAAVGIGNGGNVNTLIAGVIRELEGQGIRRDEITPAMVEGILARAATEEGKNPRVIEGTPVSD